VDDELFRWFRAQHPRALIGRVEAKKADKSAGEEGDVVVIVHTGRPGTLIGKGGATIDDAIAKLRALPRFRGVDVHVHIVEIRRLELDPILVADHVIGRIARGATPLDAAQMAVTMARRMGAKGARVVVSGADVRDGDVGGVGVVVEEDGVECRVWITTQTIGT
jgi:small subunit ribosomal protein S3